MTDRNRIPHNGASQGANFFPTASGGISRCAFERLESAGVAAGPLLSKAGLTLDEIRDPARRIRVSDQIKFLNLAAPKIGREQCDEVLEYCWKFEQMKGVEKLMKLCEVPA